MTALRSAIALAIPWLVLGLRTNPADLARFPEPAFPLEICVIALLATLLPLRAYSLFRAVAAVVLAAILFLKLADLGTGAAFQRPFNPYVDVKIMIDGWNLLSGSVGRAEAAAYIGAGIALWLALVAIFVWSLGGFRRLRRPAARGVAAIAAAVLLACVAAPAIGYERIPISAKAAPYLADRIALIRHSVADLAAFEAELGTDPIADIPEPRLFSVLAGTDVAVIFVESYGRSAIESPAYARPVAGRLREVERGIAAAGLQVRSGWLTSPTVGGLSWLAHGTLLSGLWTDSQARYDRMITSERRTINRLFRQAGWRTTAIMPAITMEWPEGAYFGYDTVRGADGLGYEGKPFNWVTMPDQYTLSAFETLERHPGHTPVMAEIALISSHAPWTPIPTLIDWEELDDGRIFDAQAEAGDPPSVVWAEPDSIRRHYLASIEYVLQTLGSYVARYGENTLFVVLGDHQPAAVITGESGSRDVPVHMIGDPAMIARIADWGWTEGMTPALDLPPVRMDGFRERFIRAFSAPRRENS
ncbi:MAG TPA: sulfatase-like hydrolase/transferase [Pseudorhizobium sp.]|nr:sulfatase-like hydrolase/transferase [Pseudorhizobium sp.]